MVHLLGLLEVGDSIGECVHDISNSFEGSWGGINSEFDESVVEVDFNGSGDSEK